MAETSGSCAVPTQTQICCNYMPKKNNSIRVNQDMSIPNAVFNNVINNKNDYGESNLNYLA